MFFISQSGKFIIKTLGENGPGCALLNMFSCHFEIARDRVSQCRLSEETGLWAYSLRLLLQVSLGIYVASPSLELKVLRSL